MSRNLITFNKVGSHLPMTVVAITSIIKNYSPDEELDIAIVVDTSSTDDGILLRALPGLYGKEKIQVNFYQQPVWPNELPQKVNTDRFPLVNFWRFDMPMMFPNYEKILHLDNDVLIYGDLSQLFNEFTGEQTIGGARDFHAMLNAFVEVGDEIKRFGIKNNFNYINAGAILFNVEKYRQQITPQLIIEETSNRELGQFADQTLLNQLFQDDIQLLDARWNFQETDEWINAWRWDHPLMPTEVRDYLLDEMTKVKIRHFLPPRKPFSPYPLQDQWERDYWKLVNEIKELPVSFPYE